MFRYRQLSDNVSDPLRVGGDMTFGSGGRNYLVDSPTAVAQAVLTRLKLWQGEWFLNMAEGTPWMQRVLGHPPGTGLPDSVVRQRIMGTPFVTEMLDYSSGFNSTTRVFAVSCRLYTAFGQVTRAPAGALISPSGNLVLPITLAAMSSEQQRELPQFMAQRLLPDRF